MRQFDTATVVRPQGPDFLVETARGSRFEGRTLIVATGAKPQRLDVPGASRLAGRGLSYSATTHGSLFLGADVAVVGRERRAQCAAADLARKAHQVYLLAPDSLEVTPVTPSLREVPNIEILENAQVREVIGDGFVDAVAVTMPGGESREIPVKGVFVKLPRTPNSELVRGWVDLDEDGSVTVDVHCATNVPGVFAAGDVTHVSEQVLVHIGEGAKAAISAAHYLLEYCP